MSPRSGSSLTGAYGTNRLATRLITPKVVGSNPTPATDVIPGQRPFSCSGEGLSACQRAAAKPRSAALTSVDKPKVLQPEDLSAGAALAVRRGTVGSTAVSAPAQRLALPPRRPPPPAPCGRARP